MKYRSRKLTLNIEGGVSNQYQIKSIIIKNYCYTLNVHLSSDQMVDLGSVMMFATRT